MFIPWKLSLWVQRVTPGFLLKPIRSVYNVFFVWIMERRFKRQQALMPRLFPQQPSEVLSGPFKGMNYVNKSVCSMLIPKLVGCYEEEIAGATEKIIAHGYDRVLNVGCAEGYYAVGIALRSPRTTVYAFDIDPEAERLCRELAQLNGVADRVIFSGGCDSAKLNGFIQGETAIVCDCEGCELDLLDPALAPKLAQADLLVELHGATDPKVSIRDTLLKRFEKSHGVQILTVTGRDPARYPILEKLPPSERALAIDENRSGTMEWGWWERKR